MFHEGQQRVDTTGLGNLLEVLESLRTVSRLYVLDRPDGVDQIEAAFEFQGVYVALPDTYLHTSVTSQAFRFLEAVRGDVYGERIQPMFGEEDGVTPFSRTEVQGAQALSTIEKSESPAGEAVWLGAPVIFRVGVDLL